MNGVVKVGLAGLVFFVASWASIFAHAAFLGQMHIEHFVSLVITTVVLLFIFWKYRDWIHTKPLLEQKFSETHAIYGWHAVVLPLLAFFVATMTIGIFQQKFIDRLMTTEQIRILIVYSFFIYILVLGLAVAATSKIIVYSGGLWTARGNFGWNDFKKAKMKWSSRLLIISKDIFIIPNPSKLLKAIKEYQEWQ